MNRRAQQVKSNVSIPIDTCWQHEFELLTTTSIYQITLFSVKS